jgi:inner membrane protein
VRDSNLWAEPGPEKPKPKFSLKPWAVMGKVLTISFLTLLLLIPLCMIGGLITERQTTQQTVTAEIAQTWGGEQSVVGPVLVLPYKSVSTQTVNGAKKKVENIYVSYLLPQQYNAKTSLQPEIRYRGIYQSVVYQSHFLAQGNFDLKALNRLRISPKDVVWKDAYVSIGIPYTKGISQRPDFQWQGKSVEMLPGVIDADFLNTGLHAPVSIHPEQTSLPFKLSLSLNGSKALMLAPIGQQNNLEITSTWASPSFVGNALPTSRKVNKDGFTATWEVPYFSRSYDQAFIDNVGIQDKLKDSTVGVQLLTSVDSYRQTDRAIKYGLLFLVLTFATYFLFEIIGKHRFHPFQYLLIGLAISLFYLLLLAISEVAPFIWAYATASVGIISVITLYSKAILGRTHKFAPLTIGSLLTILYTYLYVLLQLEDLSLLFGAIGLFIVLSLIMYLTRHIDWYSEPLPA